MAVKKKTGFGLILRELRRYQNLSQEELASRVGLNPSYISYLERGKKIHPSAEILAALSREFELKGVSRQKFYNEAHRITPLEEVKENGELMVAKLVIAWDDLHDDYKKAAGEMIREFFRKQFIDF